jgi:predicted transposase YbfD/YdcC
VSGENHYILQVKGNQKSLLRQVRINTAGNARCVDSFHETSLLRGRLETRDVSVCKDTSGISEGRAVLKRPVRVERNVLTGKAESYETACYTGDLRSGRATVFAEHVRSHWGMENRLHRVRDAVMKEDISKTAKGMAAENIAIIRNIAINLFGNNGLVSVKYAMDLCNSNFMELSGLIYSKPGKYKKT